MSDLRASYDPVELLALGTALLSQGDFQRSEAVARRVIELDPYSADAHVLLAFALLGQNRSVEARSAAERALIFERHNARAQVAISVSWLVEKRSADAEAAARTAVSLEPDLANAHFALGLALDAQKRKQEADKEYETAIALDPTGMSGAGRRLWERTMAPVLGAVAIGSVIAFEVLRRLFGGGRISPVTTSFMLLLVAGGLLVALLVAQVLRRRTLARMSPDTRTIVSINDRRSVLYVARFRFSDLLMVAAAIAVLVAIVGFLSTRSQDTLKLTVGDCVTTDKATGISSVTVVPCDFPHDRELFALLSYPASAGEHYPGAERIRSWGDAQCASLFPGYVGVPYVPSNDPWIDTWIPEKPYWDINIRNVYCMLADRHGQMNHSLRESS